MSAHAQTSPADDVSASSRPVGGSANVGLRWGGALGLAGLASLLGALGSVIDVVVGAEPAYPAWPLLTVLAILPTALASGFLLRHRPHVAAGVLGAGAVLASGRILLDSQFLADPVRASRPELYFAETLQSANPHWGLWFLLAGHLSALAAGVLALNALEHDNEQDLPAYRARQQALTAATLIGLVAGVAVTLPGFRSDNAYLLSGSALDGPELVVGGALVLAAAFPLSAALSVTARSWQITRGVLFGLAVGVVALTLPHLVAALTLPWLHVGSGSVLGLVAVVGLVAFGAWPVTRASSQDGHARQRAVEASLPGQRRLHRITGLLALLTAGLAVLGALNAQVISVLDGSAIEAPARWLLVVAAVLVAVPGVLVLVPGQAVAVRPALSVVWVAVVMVGMSLLSTSVVASRVPGAIEPGAGVWWTVLAMVSALLLAASSMVAGMVDREREEESVDFDAVGDGRLRIIVIGVGVLAAGGFGMSTIVAPDYAGSGLWQDFGVPFWGLLAGLLAVLGALALVPRCRPARASALLAAVVGVLGLRALELPLAGREIPGAEAGAGTWLTVAAMLVAALGTGVSAASHGHSRQR